MNSGIVTKHKPNAERAQRFLHDMFRMGKPEVIQADGKGAWFMFKDTAQLYKLPYRLIGSRCVDLDVLKV